MGAAKTSGARAGRRGEDDNRDGLRLGWAGWWAARGEREKEKKRKEKGKKTGPAREIRPTGQNLNENRFPIQVKLKLPQIDSNCFQISNLSFLHNFDTCRLL